MLKVLESWRDAKAIVENLGGYTASSIATAIGELVSLQAVVVEGSSVALRDKEYEQRWLWGPLAATFHFGTGHGGFVSSEEADNILRERVKFDPSPPLYSNNPKSLAQRLRQRRKLSEPFSTMARRRTDRVLRDAPIKKQVISDCLFFSMRITSILRNPTIVDLPLKMTPSGGARNPYEAYVCVRRVSGLVPAVYHYSAIEHSLASQNSHFPDFSSLLANQLWASNAAALIFLVARFERSMWKYRDPFAYKVVVIEAGHIAQNIMLVATNHGLVANPTCAINDKLARKTLRITKITEAVIYALAIGLSLDASNQQN